LQRDREAAPWLSPPAHGAKLAEDRPIIRSEAAKLGKSTMPGDCFYTGRGRIGPLEGATRQLHPAELQVVLRTHPKIMTATRAQRTARNASHLAQLRHGGRALNPGEQSILEPAQDVTAPGQGCVLGHLLGSAKALDQHLHHLLLQSTGGFVAGEFSRMRLLHLRRCPVHGGQFLQGLLSWRPYVHSGGEEITPRSGKGTHILRG
jgi:hypothetical protein